MITLPVGTATEILQIHKDDKIRLRNRLSDKNLARLMRIAIEGSETKLAILTQYLTFLSSQPGKQTFSTESLCLWFTWWSYYYCSQHFCGERGDTPTTHLNKTLSVVGWWAYFFVSGDDDVSELLVLRFAESLQPVGFLSSKYGGQCSKSLPTTVCYQNVREGCTYSLHAIDTLLLASCKDSTKSCTSTTMVRWWFSMYLLGA